MLKCLNNTRAGSVALVICALPMLSSCVTEETIRPTRPRNPVAATGSTQTPPPFPELNLSPDTRTLTVGVRAAVGLLVNLRGVRILDVLAYRVRRREHQTAKIGTTLIDERVRSKVQEADGLECTFVAGAEENLPHIVLIDPRLYSALRKEVCNSFYFPPGIRQILERKRSGGTQDIAETRDPMFGVRDSGFVIRRPGVGLQASGPGLRM